VPQPYGAGSSFSLASLNKEQDFKHGGGAAGATSAGAGATDANSEAQKLRGLYYDLEEVEKKDKSYPLTVAFVELLRVLLYATNIPNLLGGGYRAPGIAPYLNFVIREVFVPIDDRQYNDVREMWAMTELSLGTPHHRCLSFMSVRGWAHHLSCVSV
jgi:hypothetical protein